MDLIDRLLEHDQWLTGRLLEHADEEFAERSRPGWKTSIFDERFDKIFAVNVVLFWRRPAEVLGIVRKLLAPRDALYVFSTGHLGWSPRQAREAADLQPETLRENGFAIDQVLFSELRSGPAVCVIARSK